MKSSTKHVLSGVGRCLVASLLVWSIGGRAVGSEIRLEDKSVRVAFDSDSGALTRFENKATGWVTERRSVLGASFRLFAPLPDRRWNPVYGARQHAAVSKISGREVRLKWQDLVSENGGVLPITLAADVTLDNGVLVFNAGLNNDSPLTVETVDYPYFGDFSAPTRKTPIALRVMRNRRPGNLQADDLYPHFANEKGYWGVFWPLKTREERQSRFCLISAPDQGLYVEAGPGTPYRLQWTFEQHPGVISTVGNLVPTEDEIAGTPVHLEFRACHFLFTPPHASVKLTPITLRPYQGDWHSGLNLYHP